MVITAVTAKIAASARVERRMDRAVCGETIRNEVTMSTPASAASGMPETGPVAR